MTTFYIILLTIFGPFIIGIFAVFCMLASKMVRDSWKHLKP